MVQWTPKGIIEEVKCGGSKMDMQMALRLFRFELVGVMAGCLFRNCLHSFFLGQKI